MPSKFVNPFEREDFKSWVISLIPDGGKVACSVTYPDGKDLVCGDSQMGIDAFAKKFKEKKRSSMDWVIPSEKFLKIKLPLAEFVKTQSKVIMAASSIVKQFIGKSTPYGTGHCYLWEHGVDCTLVSLSVISLSFFCVM